MTFPVVAEHIGNQGELEQLITLLNATQKVCLDIETQTDNTSNLNPRAAGARIVSISFTTTPGMGYVVPLSHPAAPWPHWRDVLRRLVQAAMAKDDDPLGGKLIAHNIQYEARWIQVLGGINIAPCAWWDTMMSTHLLDENRPKDLKSVVDQELGIAPWGIDLSTPEDAPWQQLAHYNAQDTDYCYQLHELHRQQLKEDEAVARVWHYIGMPAIRAFIHVEHTGLGLDLEQVQSLTIASESELIRTERELYQWIPSHLLEEYGEDQAHVHTEQCAAWKCPVCGVEWTHAETKETDTVKPANPPLCVICERTAIPKTCKKKKDKRYPISWSPTSKFFAAFMGALAPVIETTPKGSPCWDAAVLSRLAQMGYPFAQTLLAYRDHRKKLDFLFDWQNRAVNARLFPSYKPAHVVSGRTSSQEPNIQQTPKSLRSAITAPKGHWFVEVDHSQIELRVAAELASRATTGRCEPRMLQAYLEGRDLHFEMAMKVDTDETIRTAHMLLVQSGLPPNRTGAKVLRELCEGAPEGVSEEEIIRACSEIRQDKESRSREGWSPEGGFQSTLERWNIPSSVSTTQKRFLRALREYQELVCSSQGSRPNQQPTIELSDAMPLLSRLGPSAVQELRPIWKDLRFKAKSVNFGFLYSMTAATFSAQAWRDYQLDFDPQQAGELRSAFFEQWPEIGLWHEHQRSIARRGQVRSLLGRKRRLPDIDSGNPAKVGEAQRMAINAPVQSLASDLTLLGMIAAHKALDPQKARVVGTVHDSVLLEVSKAHLKESLEIVSDALLYPDLKPKFGVELTVPLKIEYTIGRFWADPKAREVEVHRKGT
jgi:DNA polymerase I-like protein with 3'-5' exonuclease and polymerase domains